MRGQQPHLLYMFDQEPFARFFAFPPELAIDDLQYLERKKVGEGKGT